MSRSIATWKFIGESLTADLPVVLIYVLHSEGSSPGRQGFFMGVNGKGEMSGSIGGGIMEHKFVDWSKDLLRTMNAGPVGGIIKKQYHNKTVASNQSGMICSGEQTIFLYPLQKKDLVTIGRIIDTLGSKKTGCLELGPGGMGYSVTKPGQDFAFNYVSDHEWTYLERIGPKYYLHIIGGGHCALALSRLMSTMDFYIRVYDDRKDLNTLSVNEAADEKHHVKSYEDLKTMINEGSDQFVVVMTMSYRTDDITIQALLGKQFGYFGVLGSHSKIKTMIEAYRTSGISPVQLQLIHAPAGLRINSQTPEEIAVSIAAEIISVKNGRTR